MDQIKYSSRKTSIQITSEIVLKNYFSKLKNNNRCSVVRGIVGAVVSCYDLFIRTTQCLKQKNF